MLRNHFNAIEESLLSQAKIPANSGHNIHKGIPRESFVREFLDKHLSETVSTGTGEIISYASKPNEKRKQIDIVVYRRDFPKIDFGGSVNAFLADSVIATIEVKSLLTKESFVKCMDDALDINFLSVSTVSKSSSKNKRFPPGIMKYLIAYDGPKDMRTVYNWLDEYRSEKGIILPSRNSAFSDTISSPFLDTIIILGKGFIHFDNLPMRFIGDDTLAAEPDARWLISNSSSENLLLLFLSLSWATVNSQPSNELSISLYMTDFFSNKERYIGT